MSNWLIVVLVVLGASIVASLILFLLIVKDFWTARRTGRRLGRSL